MRSSRGRVLLGQKTSSKSLLLAPPPGSMRSKLLRFRRQHLVHKRWRLRKALTNTLRGYVGSASIHGVSYLAESGQHWLCRGIWLVVVLILLSTATYWSGSDYLHWAQHPVVIVAKSFEKPIGRVDFPSISICSQGFNNRIFDAILENANVNSTWFKFMVQSLISGNIDKLIESCLLRKGSFEGCLHDWDLDPDIPEPRLAKTQSLDLFLDPRRRNERGEILSRMRVSFEAMFNNTNFGTHNSTLMDLLWHTNLPCFDQVGIAERSHQYETLKWCSWKGITLPCSAIFKKFPTKEGICCSFNVDAADLYTNTPLKDWILENQAEDSATSHERGVWPEAWTNEPYPQSGKENGLVLLLDAQSHLLAPGSIKDDFTGFLAIIARPQNNPLAQEKTILLKPGHENIVTLAATEITPDPDIHGMAPQLRNCYFSHEFQLLVHRRYSRQNCVLECRMLNTLDILPSASKCVPWNFPKIDPQVKMCNPWERQAFFHTFRDIDEDRCSKCLPDCHEVQYVAAVTSAPLRRCNQQNLGISRLCDLGLDNLQSPPIWGQQSLNQYSLEGQPVPDIVREQVQSNIRESVSDNTEYDAYEKDIAMVAFYFESSTLFEYSRQARMTWIEFVAQVGGLLGLCLGLSLVSFLEFVYWFTYKLCQNR